MDRQRWNQIVSSFPAPHLLQTWEWGEIKSAFGWEPHHKVWEVDGEVAAAALILERTVNLGGMAARLRMHYTPKGPLLRDWADTSLWQQVLADLEAFARQRGAFLLKIDPDVPVGYGEPGTDDAEESAVGPALTAELEADGWHFSDEQIQFRNTVQIDLNRNEDEILATMKQKTRYNVRLAGRKGVTARRGGAADFGMLYQMYAETAVRDGFAIRGKDYYFKVWEIFLSSGMLVPLIAEVEGEAVAGLMLFAFGGTSWYLYGMSTGEHRNRMPTYLLQWEAIRASQENGCRVYDLWGAPSKFVKDDMLWGVYRFKKGLGGRVVRTVGAWDKPLRPLVYQLYGRVWPAIMGGLRKLGRRQTRQGMRGDQG